METLRYLLPALALLAVGALFGGSLYDTIVLAPNLQGGGAALDHGRLFMSAATPGNFFRVLAPASQALVIAALVVSWRVPQCRWPLFFALLALVIADLVTFVYHYPRNAIMFTAPLTVDPERLRTAASEWQTANYGRVALVFAAWVAILRALRKNLA